MHRVAIYESWFHGNDIGMNSVSCKSSWDEQFLLQIVLGVIQLYPNSQVKSECMKSKRTFPVCTSEAGLSIPTS